MPLVVLILFEQEDGLPGTKPCIHIVQVLIRLRPHFRFFVRLSVFLLLLCQSSSTQFVHLVLLLRPEGRRWRQTLF
jgi:hypothetical protein